MARHLLADPAMTLGQIAETLHVSRSTLTRALKKA
jgi:DNA-binding MarR family transcriptional regulator